MAKKFDKKKDAHYGFMITQETIERPTKYDVTRHMSIWGDRRGKLSFKHNELHQFTPPHLRHINPPEQDYNPENYDQEAYDRWYEKTHWQVWRPVQSICLSLMSGEPRIYEITWEKGPRREGGGIRRRVPKVRDVSYGGCYLLERKLQDNPRDNMLREWLHHAALMLGVKYTDDFNLRHHIMPLLGDIRRDYTPDPLGGYTQAYYANSSLSITAGRKMPGCIGRALRHTNIVDAATFIWGKKTKQHVKDFLRCVGESEYAPLIIAHAAQGLLPHEHLSYDNLKWWEQKSLVLNSKHLTRALKPLTVATRRRLLLDPGTAHARRTRDWEIEDTIRSVCLIGIREVRQILQQRGQPKTWGKYHELVEQRAREIFNAQKAAELKHLKAKNSILTTELDGTTVSLDNRQFTLKVAEDGAELAAWGNSMQHCIAQYASGMAAGMCVLFGVFEGNKLLSTGEINNGHLRQLYGKRNSRMPEPEDQAVRKVVGTVIATAKKKSKNKSGEAGLKYKQH